MKTIKKTVVFIPLLITVLLIVIGIGVLIAGQPNEIKINTSSELTRFLEKDAGKTDKRAVLYSDIELTGSFNAAALACEFDGNGHTINVKNNGVLCLFDALSETGSVKNLVLIGKLGSTDKQVVSGICLHNLGTIENCVIKSDFSGGGFVSGVCHTNSGTIANCFVQSCKTGDKDLKYIWNPICSENGGSVKNSYYSNDSLGKYETVGTFVSKDKIKSENLIDTLNQYVRDKNGFISWKADKNGYPCLESENSSEAASVFSGSTAVFLVCIIIMIVAVPIFTVIYADKQKKKVIYEIAGKDE